MIAERLGKRKALTPMGKQAVLLADFGVN